MLNFNFWFFYSRENRSWHLWTRSRLLVVRK